MMNQEVESDELCKLTIIIPNYNGLKYIKACLSSLLAQSYRNFNTIIVDNASQDGSSEFIINYYPDVKLITLNQNFGFSSAVNEGIKASSSDYIVLLNNDTEVEKDWLYNLVKHIESDENVFSVCSKMIQYHERSKIDDAGDEYNLLGWAYKRGDGKPIFSHIHNSEVFSSCAGAAIYRRKVFGEIGYFDESFFAYMEDVDISYRAKIAGYKNMYCSDAIVYHIGSATSGSKYNAFKVRLAARNNVYVPYKNMPILQLLINLPFLITGTIIKLIFFTLKGFGREYISGLCEGLTNLHKVKKIKYRFKNLKNYILIEWDLILNTFSYLLSKTILRHRG